MLTTVRQIGNSRGVLIPAAFLDSCQIEDKVDMELQNGQIIIKAVHQSPRTGWFDNVVSSPSVQNAELLETLEWDSLASDDSEWVW
jgi:antitoxin MazE